MRLLKDISVEDARALLGRDAVLVDVREPHELAVESIPGAIGLPLSAVARGEPASLPPAPTIFLCTSGARTTRNSAALAALAAGDAYCLIGGIMAWKAAGFPTRRG